MSQSQKYESTISCYSYRNSKLSQYHGFYIKQNLLYVSLINTSSLYPYCLPLSRQQMTVIIVITICTDGVKYEYWKLLPMMNNEQ